MSLTGVHVAEGSGDASGGATGVKPGALTAQLQDVAATPEKREDEPHSLPPGTVIGRFEIMRELGRGGFGVASPRHSTSPYQVAQAPTWRGEVGEAFRWLDRALADRDAGMTHARRMKLPVE